MNNGSLTSDQNNLPADMTFINELNAESSTVKNQAYPGFLVVGAAKSGTTSLHHYLELHPEVYLPDDKELYFWQINQNPNKAIVDILGEERVKSSLSSYLQCFKDASPDQIMGEVCPSYLYYHQYVIESLKTYHPNWQDVKIIIILREPVSRIISEYKFVCKHELDPEYLSFEESLLREPARLQENRMILDLFYKDLSKYSSQIEAYKGAFKNVHICLLDELKQDPQGLMNNIYSFLGVSEQVLNTPELGRHHNSSSGARKLRGNRLTSIARKLPVTKLVPEGIKKAIKNRLFSQSIHIPKETVCKLRREFESEISKLEAIINKDLSGWKL